MSDNSDKMIIPLKPKESTVRHGNKIREDSNEVDTDEEVSISCMDVDKNNSDSSKIVLEPYAIPRRRNGRNNNSCTKKNNRLPRLPTVLPIQLQAQGTATWKFDESTSVVIGDLKFDESTRVTTGDCRNCKEIHFSDKILLAQMMQHDDVTVISDGLLKNINNAIWNFDTIKVAFCNKPFHHFCRCDRIVHENDSDGTSANKYCTLKKMDSCL